MAMWSGLETAVRYIVTDNGEANLAYSNLDMAMSMSPMQRVIVLSFIDQAAPINSYPEKTASFDAVFFVQMQQNTKQIEKMLTFVS